MSVHIDSTAIVSKKAQLGDRITVGPFSIIEDDVIIGEGTTIAAHVIIQNGTRIGKNGRIFPFASVGGPPQDLKYKGEPTSLEIGDHCDIREFVTISRGTTETGKTVIGNTCMLMATSHVAHDCVLGDNCIMANSAALAGHVHLGNWVILGGLTPVHQFVRIGDHAMIGGGLRVPKDVPPYIRTGRNPMVFEGLNSIGLRRRGFSPQTIEQIDKAYFILYQSNLNVTQAVERMKEELEQTPEVKNILEFIASSKRGIISGPGHH